MRHQVYMQHPNLGGLRPIAKGIVKSPSTMPVQGTSPFAIENTNVDMAVGVGLALGMGFVGAMIAQGIVTGARVKKDQARVGVVFSGLHALWIGGSALTAASHRSGDERDHLYMWSGGIGALGALLIATGAWWMD